MTLSVIDDYIANVYTKSEAIKRLEPQKLTDQYALISKEAIKLLKFLGAERI